MKSISQYFLIPSLRIYQKDVRLAKCGADGWLRSKGRLRESRAVRPALCHQPVVTELSVPSFVEGL